MSLGANAANGQKNTGDVALGRHAQIMNPASMPERRAEGASGV